MLVVVVVCKSLALQVLEHSILYKRTVVEVVVVVLLGVSFKVYYT